MLAPQLLHARADRGKIVGCARTIHAPSLRFANWDSTNFEYHNPLSPAERYLERMPNVQSSRVVPSTQGIDRGHIRGTTLYMPRERRHNPAKALQHIPFRMTRPSGSRHVQMPYSSSLLHRLGLFLPANPPSGKGAGSTTLAAAVAPAAARVVLQPSARRSCGDLRSPPDHRASGRAAKAFGRGASRQRRTVTVIFKKAASAAAFREAFRTELGGQAVSAIRRLTFRNRAGDNCSASSRWAFLLKAVPSPPS